MAGESLDVLLRAASGPQVDGEGQGVEAEDEGDGPLEVGGVCEVVLVGEGTECDDERGFDDDEGELDPERQAKQRVLAVLCEFVSDMVLWGSRVQVVKAYSCPGAGTPSRRRWRK